MTSSTHSNVPVRAYQFFVFVWPGHLEHGVEIERKLQLEGEDVVVIASGVPQGPPHWVHLSNNEYFGAQFSRCLQIADCDVLVHIQADAAIADVPEFIGRMKSAFSRGDIAIWSPDIDYTFYRTSLVQAPRRPSCESADPLPKHLVPILNTDCTCWALRSDVVTQLRSYCRPDWNLGWGWDSLAAACAWTGGSLVVRDVGIVVSHPRGTGYDSAKAETEFVRVKSDLPVPISAYIAVVEALIMARYRRSRHWLGDRVRARVPVIK